MVAKEKLLIFIATIIVIFIITALVFPSFSNMLPLENPFLQGKDAFVRYYACSLAICTQGCNWLSSNDICLKRNIWGNCTMTCKTEICDKQPGFGNCGNKGMCCNETYSIYLSLKGNAKFSVEKIYNWGTGSVSIDWVGTEIHQIMDNFKKSPKEKKPQFPLNILSPSCPFWGTVSKAEGTFYKMGNDDPSQIKYWSQTGAIYMTPAQAEPYFTCIDYDKNLGYSECTFKGYLQIYSWDPNNNNCADVLVINGQDPFTADFEFFAANEGKAKIPIDHTGPIALYILNGLGFSETFTMQIIKPLPEGITCDFNGEDTTVLNVEDTKVGTPDVPLTCKPTALPPAGGFEVWVKAWDGTKTQAVKLKIDVGDFKLTLASPSPLIINAGNSGSFIFDLTNTIGIDATFQLTSPQSPDNDVGCTFNGEITSIDVADSATKQITLNCAPISNARNKDYDITVTATWDTTKRTAVAKVTVPNCTVTNLALKFLDSSNTEIASATVNSADAVKLKADGFSGCQNMNVRFILSVGSKILYQNSVGTSGDLFYYPQNPLNFLTANSPEKWEMYVQMDENGDETYEKESPRRDLTINAPTPAGYGGEGNTDRCHYDIVDCNGVDPINEVGLCNECESTLGWWYPENCNACFDPQSCLNSHDDGQRSSNSNICCKSDESGNGLDTYSPGLTDAPCLSPDTNTHNYQNSYFNWTNVDNPKNLLVSESNIEYSYPAVFNHMDCNSDASKCKDLTGYIDAECREIVSYRPGMECIIKGQPDTNYYSSWLFIKISDSSRPVYGVKIKVGVVKAYDSKDASWDVYIHTKDGGGKAWTKIGSPGASFNCVGVPLCIGYHFIEANFKPVGVAWQNVDALLIAFKRGYRLNPPDWSYTENGVVDYVGLLTNSTDNIPYCTDGPGGASSPSTYRTVDNGKTCYWRVDCETYSGNGWTGTDSKKMGPFVSVPICDCETDTNNCGDGVCGPVTLNEQNYRFDNVRCVYGGWMGNLVKI
jgi:hypothetical protein